MLRRLISDQKKEVEFSDRIELLTDEGQMDVLAIEREE